MRKNSFRWRESLTAFAPLIVWVGVIFYLSSSSGSMTATSRFIRPMLELVFPYASEEALLTYHFYIRKFAHITEYAVLGLFAARAFLLWSFTYRVRFAFAISLVLTVLIAIGDEFNQSFDPSRTSSSGDVLLDCLGGFLAIAAYISIRSYFFNTKETNLRSTL